MELGMIGLGRMGAGMVRRLLLAGCRCVAYDVRPESVEVLARDGALGAHSPAELVAALQAPRSVWLMLPASVVESALEELAGLLAPGDTIVDGGNSHYHDDIRRAKRFRSLGIDYLDVGTSGGVWGLERGYCLMIGGDEAAAGRLGPVFAALAPGAEGAVPTPGLAREDGTASLGYLHCGPSGAGHFVKMVHNGIEYGLMAAYAEGFNILRHADIGSRPRSADAETTPLRHAEHYRYQLNLADIAELWRRGSVIASWLLDLTADALGSNPELTGFSERVADSGEGRWALAAAIEESVPAPVLSAALFDRFSSRGEDEFANRLLGAMRSRFGGHGATVTKGGSP